MKDAWPLIAVLVVVGLVITYWKVLLTIAAVIVVLMVSAWAIPEFVVPWWHRRRELTRDRRNAETARRSSLAARADTQHERYLEGDPRGIYGDYPPADLG